MANLEVVFSVIDEATNTLKKIDAQFEQMGKNVKTAIEGFAIATAAIEFTKHIGEMVKKSEEFAESIEHASLQMGMSTDDVQKWGYVAKESGTSIEAVSKGFTKIGIEAYRAVEGNTAAQAAFAKLGVSVKDQNGVMKSNSDLIHDAVLKLADIQSPAERAAKATDMFGKSGRELLPILAEGKDKINEQFEAAEKLGLVISEKTVTALAEAKKQSDINTERMKVLTAELTVGLAPAFNLAATAIQKMVEWYTKIGSSPSNITEITQAIKEQEKEIKKLENRDPLKWWDFDYKNRNQKLINDIGKAKAKLLELQSEKRVIENRKNDGPNPNATAGDDAANDKAVDAARKRADLLKKIKLDTYNENLKSLYTGFQEGKKIREQAAKEEDEFETKRYKAMAKAKISAMPAATEDQRMKKERASFLNNLNNEFNDFKGTEDQKAAYAQQCDDIVTQYDEEQSRKRIENARKEKTAKIEQFDSMAKGYEGALNTMLSATKASAEAKKAIAMIEAAINTALAITRDLSKYGYPECIAPIALDIATGVAEEVSIASQSFASGTRFAPGGWSLVGEFGPELRRLNRGDQIYNNHQTQNMLGGNTHLNVTLVDNSGSVASTLHRQIRSGAADPLINLLKQRVTA